MKVVSIEPAGGEYIAMDTGIEYRRYSRDGWEQLYGMSWEDISHRCEEQEAAYQAALVAKDYDAGEELTGSDVATAIANIPPGWMLSLAQTATDWSASLTHGGIAWQVGGIRGATVAEAINAVSALVRSGDFGSQQSMQAMMARVVKP